MTVSGSNRASDEPRIFSARCGGVHAGTTSLHSGELTKSVDREVVATVLSRFAPRSRACTARSRTRLALRPGAVAQHAQLLAMRSNYRIIPTEQNSVEEPQRKLIGLSQQRRNTPSGQ